MLHWLEYEEQVGRLWHRLVGDRVSYPDHPDAAVALDEVKGALGVFFRGLGGDFGVQIAGASARTSRHRLSFKQRVGMEDERLVGARIDEAHMLLPPRIALFAESRLNRRMYFWLAAFLAQLDGAPIAESDPLRRDIQSLRRARRATRRTLEAFPGLRGDHRDLCAALRQARPSRRLPKQEAEVEACIAALLGGPEPDGEIWAAILAPSVPLARFKAVRGYRPFLPVPLWGEVAARKPSAPPPDEADEDADGRRPEAEEEGPKRNAARRDQDQANRDDPLILNNKERILGIAEMVNVNRGDEEEKDEDAARHAADQMDEITLSKHDKKAATRLRLDLDLPPDAAVSGRVTGRHVYPEWDFRTRAYHPDYCRVEARVAGEENEDWQPSEETKRLIRRVRRQFEALRPRQVRLHGEPDGDELDLEALVRARADLAAQGRGSERVHSALRKTARDLSVAFLVDVSLSTDSWMQNRRVLDVEKEALTVLAHGLDACGDEHAIFTFTSRKNTLVRVETVKDFDERLGESVRRRINALKPQFYTRMGAALRHVAKELSARPHRHRLLVVLTDGKPNDLDHYEGRYGVEDTRRAVQEARRAGLAVFGVTIDRKAQDYFPRIFGRGSFAIVDALDRLSAALPKIYRQLVG